MQTVAERPRLISCLLREDAVRGFFPLAEGQKRVDWDKGIIYGVKVLGRTSPNRHGVDGVTGTEYTLESLRKALPLYEGSMVNVDHPPREKPGQDRSSYDRAGKLFNCRVTDDGIFGDLRLLKKHRMADTLMEAAEREDMADCFALSHNAWGKGRIEGGKYVVYEIPEVRSVEIVADGGTTTSLFESRHQTETPMKTTLKKLLESAKNKTLAKALLEMGEDMPLMDEPVPAPPAEPEGDWKSDLVNAIGKLVASEDTADHELAKKIMAMLKPAAAETAKVEESEDEDKKTMESKIRSLELKDGVRELCESQKFQASKTQLKALCGLGTDAERIELIKELKESKPAASGAPRSNGAHHVQESREAPKPINDYSGFKALLN